MPVPYHKVVWNPLAHNLQFGKIGQRRVVKGKAETDFDLTRQPQQELHLVMATMILSHTAIIIIEWAG